MKNSRRHDGRGKYIKRVGSQSVAPYNLLHLDRYFAPQFFLALNYSLNPGLARR